jgi:ribosomal protein L11 methyltransferase
MDAQDGRMSWISIECHAAAGSHDALCGLLESAGALAVTSLDAADQPVLEPLPGQTPLWPEVRLTALFEGDYDPAPLLALLASMGVAASSAPVADQDWARSGQDVRPRHFGGRLWVCPTGAAAPAPDALVLRLDAGLAFGTGAHPTTALCLRWLAHNPALGGEVIDWGCGSGILGVAAALLGAQRVWALDIDPQALTATADNAARNAVSGRLQTMSPDDLPAGVAADLILANILAPVLVSLAPRLLDALRPGGVLLLSGLLESQVPEVMAAFGSSLRFDVPIIDQGWACVNGSKR